jgi:hypothetical protein
MSANKYTQKPFEQFTATSQNNTSIKQSLETICARLVNNGSPVLTIEELNAELIAVSVGSLPREEFILDDTLLEEFNTVGLVQIYNTYIEVLEKAANLPQETKQDLIHIRKTANS